MATIEEVKKRLLELSAKGRQGTTDVIGALTRKGEEASQLVRGSRQTPIEQHPAFGALPSVLAQLFALDQGTVGPAPVSDVPVGGGGRFPGTGAGGAFGDNAGPSQTAAAFSNLDLIRQFPFGNVGPVPQLQSPDLGTPSFDLARTALAGAAPTQPEGLSQQEILANVLAGAAGGGMRAGPLGSIGQVLAGAGAGGQAARAGTQREERRAQERFNEQQRQFQISKANQEANFAMQIFDAEKAQAIRDFETDVVNTEFVLARKEVQPLGNGLLLTTSEDGQQTVFDFGSFAAAALATQKAKLQAGLAALTRKPRDEVWTYRGVEFNVTDIENAGGGHAANIARFALSLMTNTNIPPEMLKMREELEIQAAMLTLNVDAERAKRAITRGADDAFVIGAFKDPEVFASEMLKHMIGIIVNNPEMLEAATFAARNSLHGVPFDRDPFTTTIDDVANQ